MWKAKVKILFDGRTSAGQVSEPFPAGGVLGSRDGEFYFYVVDADSAQLEIGEVEAAAFGGNETLNGECSMLNVERDDGGFQHSALNIEHSASSLSGSNVNASLTRLVRPGDGPITFTVTKPAGLNDVTLTYTTTMPGFLLEEGTKSALSYTYDAPELAEDFPNLDLYDSDGYAGADTITISLLVSGTDASGVTKHVARQIVIQGEELQMPDQHPRPKRRAVR